MTTKYKSVQNSAEIASVVTNALYLTRAGGEIRGIDEDDEDDKNTLCFMNVVLNELLIL